jgi:hypothetical protein
MGAGEMRQLALDLRALQHLYLKATVRSRPPRQGILRHQRLVQHRLRGQDLVADPEPQVHVVHEVHRHAAGEVLVARRIGGEGDGAGRTRRVADLGADVKACATAASAAVSRSGISLAG